MQRIHLFRSLLASVLLAFAGASVAEITNIPPTGHVQIEASHGLAFNNCLQAPPLGGSNKYVEAECIPVDSRQMFTFHSAGGDYWYIKNSESGRCLTLGDPSTSVIDLACAPDMRAMWKVSGTQSTGLFLGTIHAATMNSQCLRYDLGELRTGGCDEDADWMMVGQDYRAPRSFVRLKVARGGLCMSDDEWPVLRDCDVWAKYDAISTSDTGESFKLNNYSAGTCLIPGPNPSEPNHQYVRNVPCDNANANWRLHPVGDKWIVQHIATGLCLNARYGASTAGTPLIVWSCVQTTDNMLWSMTRK
jgi:hypothetical protein